VNFEGSTVWPDLGIVTRQMRCAAMHGGARRHIRSDFDYFLLIHFICDSNGFHFNRIALI
jgi:hypothetical protein